MHSLELPPNASISSKLHSYAPLLFSQAGLTSQEASFLASGISGIVLVVCTIPAQYWLMDRWGRRSTTIAGGLGMAACMITLGAIKASKTESAFGKWLSVAVIYVFIATYVMASFPPLSSSLRFGGELGFRLSDSIINVYAIRRFSLTWAVCLKV